MLQLMAFMFAPYYLFGISMDTDWKYGACAVGFILNYSAYFAEIYRSGLQSIPKGQYEAALVLGYSRSQTFFKIVLPQVIKRIMPAMGNEIITLVKDTSLAFVLGIAEMFSVAKAISASEVSMIPYALAALIYWVSACSSNSLLAAPKRRWLTTTIKILGGFRKEVLQWEIRQLLVFSMRKRHLATMQY